MNDEILARLNQMAQWIDGFCLCPCCGDNRKCEADCTFAEDDPQSAERMESARRVLYGELSP